MALFRSLDQIAPAPRVVALGTFDGVHRGHEHVVRAAVQRGHDRGVPTLVATFHPRPVSVLVPGTAAAALTTLERRIELLSALGVDDVLVIEFTATLAALTPAAFVDEVMIGRIGAVEIVVGQNFHFGRARSGNARVLEQLGADRGIGVTVVPLRSAAGAPTSSSRIRELLAAGDVAEAATLLGRPPALEGVVGRGDARGRELGVPTANLDLRPGMAVPAEGVYAGEAVLPDDRRYRAAISIGTNPTFAGARALRVEAHLLDFDADLYGLELRLELRRRLRGQERYDSVDALVRQMQADIAAARTLEL